MITVFGSINMDLVVRAERFAQPGETLSASAFFTAPGGKGANQAVAAARLGAAVRMVGRVGNDVFGTALIASLKENGVDGSCVESLPGPSGVALITVDAAGQNTILVAAGANARLSEQDGQRLEHMLEAGDILLLQLETPMPGVIAAARAARNKGALVILDPAPAVPIPEELVWLVDIITPNQSEAGVLLGGIVEDPGQTAQRLYSMGFKRVLLKLGEQGALWYDGAREVRLPAFAVQAVDSVAAGDTFNGAFAVATAAGRGTEEAIRFASAAAAISVTRQGAQPSMPRLAEVDELLNR